MVFMKILIIGSNGQLGWELGRRCKQHGMEAVLLDLPEFDITEKEAVFKRVETDTPGLIVNVSAYTAVDQAENDVAAAFKVNSDGPAYLAEACSNANIPMIHISTDYVFDGKANKPYLATDEVSPVGVYGESKASGEEEVRFNLEEHIIVRTAWVYGVHGVNFVKTMLRLGGEVETLRVVSDQKGCPTFAGDLADAVLVIAKTIISGTKVQWGTYHYCGMGITTWFDFARQVFKIAGSYTPLKIKELIPISTSEYPTPAKRPEYSALDCSLIENVFNIIRRPWQESLEFMIKELYQQDNN